MDRPAPVTHAANDALHSGTNGANGNGANGHGANGHGQYGTPSMLVSVGGGRIGNDLLSCPVKASYILEQSQPHRMLMLAGPFLPEAEFAELGRVVADRPHLTLRRYTQHFLSRLSEADLSVSMAGYNTCMNVLTTGCRALVLPFANPGNEEQTIRANKLEQLGLMQVIRPAELSPEVLADKSRVSLEMDPPRHQLDTRGVERSVEAITELVADPVDVPVRSWRTDPWGDALGPGAFDLRRRLERC